MIAFTDAATAVQTVIDAGCVLPAAGICVTVFESNEKCEGCGNFDRVTIFLPEFGLEVEHCTPTGAARITIETVAKLRRMAAAPNN